MKQYGTAPTNFTSTSFCRYESQKRMEAILIRSYGRMVRGNRRRDNSDPVKWWREQVRPAQEMPSMYHCGGYGK